METRSIRSLTLYFDAEEGKAAQVIGDACERSLNLVRELWELEARTNRYGPWFRRWPDEVWWTGGAR